MKKIIFLFCVLHSAFFIVTAQNKMNRTLLQKVNTSFTLNTSEFIEVLVRGDAGEVKKLTENLGGKFKYSSGDISSVTIPAGKISGLAKSNKISRIEFGQGKLNLLNDKMVINNNVTAVHNGNPPLAKSYDGEGIIVAVLDCGIDVTHPDFNNPDGTTRIKYIWDQYIDTASGEDSVKPYLQPYGYGQEWTEAEINASLCNQKDPWAVFGCYSHGSNVAGIAAGNGLALNQYTGMAPKADIIFVAMDFNKPADAVVPDAIDYIFKKADSLGKPCVVNMSFGDYFGSHDGKDIVAEFIDNKIKEKNGRVVACAAGNGSTNNFHLGYDVETDSSFTWFANYIVCNSSISDSCYNGSPFLDTIVYFIVWADTQKFQDVDFTVGSDNPSTLQKSGRTPYYNVKNDYPFLQSNLFDSTTATVTNSAGDRIGVAKTYIEINNGRYLLEIFVDVDSFNYLWRFMTKGSGRFDLWSQMNITGTSSMYTAGLPDSATYPEIKKYKYPDTDMTLVSSWNCSPNVLSAGMYQNRSSYTDINGDIQLLTAPLYEIADNSGRGPTRDGRQKPDITASGRGVLSPVAPGYQSYTLPSQIAWGGMHSRNGGTSMASPMVAGAAALYLQMKPNASYKEVICAVHQSARIDSFTGNNIPDYQWGYGKLDVYSMLNQNIICGCTDPTAINYNPNANCDDGNCKAVIYGCTDSTSSNYNPLANFDDGSCITVLSEKNKSPAHLANFPNPFKNKTVFHYNLNRGFSKAAIKITDVLGKEIKSIPITNEQGIILLNDVNFSPGIYFYSLIADHKILTTKRMAVVE